MLGRALLISSTFLTAAHAGPPPAQTVPLSIAPPQTLSAYAIAMMSLARSTTSQQVRDRWAAFRLYGP